ncbi:ABC transporter ATP-binding protein, partial [Candidatus Saccharibacteria bacterium]|nr:ABC transporter ATP-binding protein [Candidatus Saccharibacteria bacterium]
TKKLVAHFSDSIVNAPTVKTFAREKDEVKRNKQLNDELYELRIKDWVTSGNNGNLRAATLLTGIVILLFILNTLTSKNPDAIGIGFFAFIYTFTIILRLFDISIITRQVEESFLNARPIMDVLLQENEVDDAKNAKALVVNKGAVTFQNISFHYEDSGKSEKVFHNLNITVNPGEKVGLVGPSGGGKTTLTRLLLRFDDLQEGRIEIDGQNIAESTQESLRQNIGYVPQEPLLFHRTIRENIVYGASGAPDEMVTQATKKAQALEFISKLSEGFDTIVGERGVKLSGGQRQRVAIARAILKNAPILVLDEATSALDSESELSIQRALEQLMKGKTTIVIAHRLSTIQKMDRIIVLDDGKIVEEGKHTELLKKKNGLYARLWKHQSGGFLQD